jgi:hypothetical protein
VNRRLDELGRPLPRIVRVGSLKEICKELGMIESGKNTRDVRTAFLQNASAFITAHLSYRGADSIERRLQAGFTRYGVVFTGDKLPDGQRADAVYITLNAPYWEVVNSAPVRPLNYDYLKNLTPAAQRFYEIVSFRIYASFKNGRAAARIAYSDYCAFSAQQRYYDQEHFRVQMYKVHKPHLQSGYLASVRAAPAADGEGKPDWILIYTPGPKARVEYDTFSRKQKDLSDGEPEPPPGAAEPPAGLLAELIRRGVAEARARQLLSGLSGDELVQDQLEWGDYLVRTAPEGKFTNPPGLFVSLLRDNILPPPDFETTRRRKLRQEGARAEDRRRAEEAEQRLRYDEYREREAARRLEASSSEPDYQARLEAHRRSYIEQFPRLPPKALEEICRRALQAELVRDLPSFEEFCSSGLKDPSGR